MNDFVTFFAGWSTVMSGNTPPAADGILLILIFLAALSQWFAVGVSGPGAFNWRSVVALGWTLWATRFFWSLIVGDDPIIPPISSVAISLVAIGAILRNLHDSRCVKCFSYKGRGS